MARRNARDVVVRFLADVKGFLAGTDDVEDAYRDMARDADRAADAGERSARDLSTAYTRAADKITRESREAGRATKGALGDAGREAGSEFAQNLGESISSGDVSGILSGTVGGLAGTFGARGPIGLALAGLSGAGVAAFAAIRQGAEDAKQAAIDAFDEILSKADREARLRGALERTYGSYLEGLEAIGRMADSTGIPIERIADAFAEGGPAARGLADSAERIASNLERVPVGAHYAPTNADALNARRLADDLDRAAAATERAAAAEDNRADALRLSGKYYQEAYGAGSSVYASQVPAAARYTGGGRG